MMSNGKKGIKIKKSICVLALILLTGCKANNNNSNADDTLATKEKTYVDVDKKTKEIKKTRLDTKVFGYSGDTRDYMAGNSRTYSAFDDRYFYCFHTIIEDEVTHYGRSVNSRVDLKNGRVSSICNIAGCAHADEKNGCLDFFNYGPVLCIGEDMYFLTGNKLMCQKGDSTETLYENTYRSELQKELFPDAGDMLSLFFMHGDKLYIGAIDYLIEYDLATGKASDPFIISDRNIYACCTDGKVIYYCTDTSELYAYDISMGKKQKLQDNVTRCSLHDGELYYIRFEDGVPFLYAYTEGKPELILENCYITYCRNGEYIYYQHYAGDRDIFMYDTKEKKSTKLLIDYTKLDQKKASRHENSKLYDFMTADFLDSVFLVDDTGTVFVFKAGSTEYKAIDLTR